MSTLTTRLGLVKPDPSDNMWDVNNHLNANLDKLDAAAPFIRGAADPASPYQGQTWVRSDKGDTAFTKFGATIYDFIREADTINGFEDETDQTTTSTSYVAGAAVVSTTFTAPPNGRVWVEVSGTLEINTTDSAWLSYEIRNTDAAGAVVVAANDRSGLLIQGSHYVQGSRRTWVTGLTPLTQTYYIQTMLKSGNAAATASAFWRRIEVGGRQ